MMKARIILSMIFIFALSTLYGQVADGAFHISWTTLKPTYKEFVAKTSSQGIRAGFSKFVNEKFGFGIEGGYSVLNDYVPLETYQFPGGAITTDIYNYMYFYSLAVNGQYYFKTSEVLIPYVSLGAGVAYTDYTLYYNVYSDADDVTAFLLRPEAGVLYRFGKYAGTGVKAAIGYDYAFNKSDYFEVDNFSALSFQIGLVLFNR
jgi:membrane associated rhomboid family serine protease